MRKIAIGLGAAALALAPVGIANATGGNTGNSVSINEYADYDFAGTNLDVGLQVRCTGGSGSVVVDVDQAPPETPYPVGWGSGPQILVCDGRSRSVAVTLIGAGFDAGKAKATATVVAPGQPTKVVSRQITIRVV